MSRLTGPEIRRQVELGTIQIDPYDRDRVQAASVDLTLGEEVAVYDRFVDPYLQPRSQGHEPFNAMDVRERHLVRSYKLGDQGSVTLGDQASITLVPGILYLMHTRERLHTLKYEIDVTGKSSLGRLGIIVHHTAGHIDPGFDGQVTLEVAVVHPVKIYGGMPFCQARFHTLEGEVEDYRKRGNYVGDAARGAQASRSWKQS